MTDPTGHLMLREIREQPGAIEQTLAAEGDRIRELAAVLRERCIRHVLLAARGTSDNAADYARYLFGLVNGVVVTSVASSLFTVYRAKLDLSDCLVLGISQSGAATDVMDVLESARRGGALTAALTNTEDAPITRAADFTLLTRASKQEAVPATKTYTTALAVLHQLSAHWAQNVEMAESIHCVPGLMEQAFGLEVSIHVRSERYRFMETIAVLSRGLNFCTAHETALKLAECCLVVPATYSGADFLHGPIATVNEQLPCMLIVPSGDTLGPMLEVAVALQHRNAEMLVISNEPALLELGAVTFELPRGMPEPLSPMVAIVVGQLFAYHLALHKRLDPDHPPGLSVVTRTM